MKHTLLILSTLSTLSAVFSASPATAQMIPNQSIRMEYDARGNRVVRKPWTSGGATSKRDDGREVLTPAASGFSIYPNPTTDRTTVELSEADSNLVQVRLYDALGQLLHWEAMPPGQTTITLNLEGRPAGLFKVVLIRQKNTETLTLIHE